MLRSCKPRSRQQTVKIRYNVETESMYETLPSDFSNTVRQTAIFLSN